MSYKSSNEPIWVLLSNKRATRMVDGVKKNNNIYLALWYDLDSTEQQHVFNNMLLDIQCDCWMCDLYLNDDLNLYWIKQDLEPRSFDYKYFIESYFQMYYKVKG